jgi:DpnII restriction endonuclease
MNLMLLMAAADGGAPLLETRMPIDTSWIANIDAENFLAILDVALDVEKELNISSDPEHIAIPIFPMIIRFSRLFPGDTIGMRDRYCELRWKATAFLQKKGVISGFEVLEGGHRWESRLAMKVNESDFGEVLALLKEEYAGRTSSKGQEKPGPETDEEAGLQNARLILSRFHSVVTQLRRRHGGRSTLDVNDEYDVQDLLRVLLSLYFDDVRAEEWTPSYAGKSSRVDFFLKPEGIVIEAKRTRSGLGEKEIGSQLIEDIERYRKLPGCKRLICLVYDPEDRISNPGGFQSDLSRETEGFAVEVWVIPKRY